jgi:hypothetical protein
MKLLQFGAKNVAVADAGLEREPTRIIPMKTPRTKQTG